MLHLLFERATLWGLAEVQRNPFELVKVKGGSRWQKILITLTREEFQQLLPEIRESIRTMAIVALCTGLRILEVLALHLKPIGERIGIMGLGWHAFRHSYHGLLDETGANAGMQKGLMRHANISTTMNVYGRAAMKAKQKANSKVVQMVLPRKALCA